MIIKNIFLNLELFLIFLNKNYRFILKAILISNFIQNLNFYFYNIDNDF